MSHNNFKYWFVDMNETSEMIAQGYSINEVSTDGNLALVDKQDETVPTITNPATIPSYLDANDYPDFPETDNHGAKDCVDIHASTVGGSDGWSKPAKT